MIFKQPPTDFKKEVDVVGCYVLHDGRFVVLHRHDHKSNGGLWGLPAGKCDPDEQVKAAMVRELREETGIHIALDELTYIRAVSVRHGHDFEYHMFTLSLPSAPEIQLSPSEHQAFRWVTPEESLLLPLVHDQAECTKIMFGIE